MEIHVCSVVSGKKIGRKIDYIVFRKKEKNEHNVKRDNGKYCKIFI